MLATPVHPQLSLGRPYLGGNRMDFFQTNGVRYAKVWIWPGQNDWLSKALTARQRLVARAGGQWLAVGGYWDGRSEVVVFKAKPEPISVGY